MFEVIRCEHALGYLSSAQSPQPNADTGPPPAALSKQVNKFTFFPLISIIACFKGFDTYAAEGQRRALRSWMTYRPYVEIIMLCDDFGVAQVAKENWIKHVPGVEVTRHGVPYWKSVVLLGQQHASAPYVMFVNGDIVLRGSIIEPVLALTSRGITDFVLSGRRYDVNASAHSEHSLPVGWETSNAPVEELQRALDPSHGNFGEAMRMDYFVFPRGKLNAKTTPNFQIGMLKWDGWLWDQWEEDVDMTSPAQSWPFILDTIMPLCIERTMIRMPTLWFKKVSSTTWHWRRSTEGTLHPPPAALHGFRSFVTVGQHLSDALSL